jgi:hypothetical protein
MTFIHIFLFWFKQGRDGLALGDNIRSTRLIPVVCMVILCQFFNVTVHARMFISYITIVSHFLRFLLNKPAAAIDLE